MRGCGLLPEVFALYVLSEEATEFYTRPNKNKKTDGHMHIQLITYCALERVPRAVSLSPDLRQ